MRSAQAATPRATTTPSTSPAAGADLVAEPAAPLTSQPVTLRVTGSTAGPADYRWDSSGHGAYRLDTGHAPSVVVHLRKPGAHLVGVKITRGPSVQKLTLRLVVRSGVSSPRPGLRTRGRSEAPRRTAVAQVAADPGVTIVDFRFSPGTTSIRVGDTITWTNNGPSPHTATANDHSFDTGVVQKGQSASHTFTHPGTFSYICTIHPFMKGTIVVEAASSTPPSNAGSGQGSSSGTSSNSTGTGTGSSTSSSSGSSATGQSLPFTGVNLLAIVLCGVLLMGSGTAVRWLVRRRHRASVGD